MFAVLNHHVAINLRRALEESHARAQVTIATVWLSQKAALEGRERKSGHWLKTIKESAVSPHCSHSPNPYSIKMSASSWNPGEPVFQWSLLGPLRHPPLTVFSLCRSYFLSLKLALQFSVLTVNFKTHFSPWWGDEPLEKYRRRVLNPWVVTRQAFKLLPYSAISSRAKKVSLSTGVRPTMQLTDTVRNGTGNGSYSERRAWLGEWRSPARACVLVAALLRTIPPEHTCDRHVGTFQDCHSD